MRRKNSVLGSIHVAIRECHTGDLNHRHLFFTILEVGKFKIKVPEDPVSAEGTHFGLQTDYLPMGSSHSQEQRKGMQALSGLLIGALIPFPRAPFS